MDLYDAAEELVRWLDKRLVSSARGDELNDLDVEPGGRFWLGRLAPEASVIALGLGERGERLDPCATGMVLRPVGPPPWRFDGRVRAKGWLRGPKTGWRKTSGIDVLVTIVVPTFGEHTYGASNLAAELAKVCGTAGLMCEVRVEAGQDASAKPELEVQLVNTSPQEHPALKDTNLYECVLEVSSLPTEPFILEALPDSFRYDRRVPAYGINGGVERTEAGGFRTVDVVRVDRGRPVYWSISAPVPDLSFRTLADDPLPSLHELRARLAEYAQGAWSDGALDARARNDLWSTAMREQAAAAAEEFAAERQRIEDGLALLENDASLLTAFRLMNEALLHSANGRYDGWRPFQIGFLLANLRTVTHPEAETDIADIVWFATGGGKTETYLGLLVTAALYDRLRGKSSGITAWSRFPLRMLSLQQTQRFADAMAGAELARRRAGIGGEPFSVGFFVGDAATPNQIKLDAKHWEPDPNDPEMPARYRVLLTCPFCHQDSVEMEFNRRYWRLEHRCRNQDCAWPEPALPFYIVDYEIYRFLPTIIVGTLDKAALIAQQAAMRGFVGAPLGRCSGDGHGYVYAPRQSRRNGCLVPGCRFKVAPLDMPADLFAPSFRLQDELHLLKDSLGAVDAHYESLLDHLQFELATRKPKILASSATLTGYAKQVEVLYRRSARVFPVPGPTAAEGFWTSESERLARRFVAVAPRGATLEFAVDRTLTELQLAVRRLVTEPNVVCAEIGVDPLWAPDLASLYGVDVVYGNTLRDLDAAIRSLETQVPVDGALNTATLTGRTDFNEVRRVLQRLQEPEADFHDRLHIIAASSMMSHGVDVDRLNVMAVLGLPLTTAEFIQTTARVGRRWPGLVFVFHKIARERDASVYRSFGPFVRQGDRFVEPVPVTRRSRRVLERTIAGIELARIWALHEPRSGTSLATVNKLRAHFQSEGITMRDELDDVIAALGLDGALDGALRDDLEVWFDAFFRNLEDPGGTFRFPSDLCPLGGPMRSLRDVEEQAPIKGVLE